MISLIVCIIACVLKNWWLFLLGICIDNYFVDKRIKELKERIEELEEKL